ncbi:hypothetical protein FQA47_016548 [Oryzias melastigma]|uniref:Uncharacterized protein n=1 Tax=Oryzias melastigma TaxID=30732 RepID=A0A834BWW1_ORYME|nr:hypothetical protein FQA47_016548 [Oryzias melastigma]
MSGQRRGKTLIITDDEEEEEEQADQLNPFSFREFMRWKTHDPDEEQDQNRVERDLPHLDVDVSSCFLSETHLAPQEEEDWGRSFQSGVESTSSLCTEDDEEEEEETRFSSKPEGSTENYEGDEMKPPWPRQPPPAGGGHLRCNS